MIVFAITMIVQWIIIGLLLESRRRHEYVLQELILDPHLERATKNECLLLLEGK